MKRITALLLSLLLTVSLTACGGNESQNGQEPEENGGLAISASDAASAQDQVNEWLGGLGYVTAE